MQEIVVMDNFARKITIQKGRGCCQNPHLVVTDVSFNTISTALAAKSRRILVEELGGKLLEDLPKEPTLSVEQQEAIALVEWLNAHPMYSANCNQVDKHRWFITKTGAFSGLWGANTITELLEKANASLHPPTPPKVETEKEAEDWILATCSKGDSGVLIGGTLRAPYPRFRREISGWAFYPPNTSNGSIRGAVTAKAAYLKWKSEQKT